MPQIRPAALSKYLLRGQLVSRRCLRTQSRIQASPVTASTASLVRYLHTATATGEPPSNEPAPIHVPLRKQLKDEAKKQKESGTKKKKNVDNQVVDGWELTVGIEIHAQLNTEKKLFSDAATSFNDDPNTHVAYFDLATPGSQPIFQKAALVPALRAALALNCDIQLVSRFDRKHYFHWDQPSGYQITQYYEPFARDGHLRLRSRDGIAAEDGEGVSIGIKQIQMEQDTAKTVAQPGDVHWIDFNRVGMPLIEIITHPEFHHPATAAAFVRKVQTLLDAVDACVSGMEAGGLRADVNVSVRRTDDPNAPLGQRTEIKNLSSFKAVEDAIIAERDRQIAVLEAGGTIAGETRGWSIGSTETRRLRGKEGEVDYRYMPDPDIPPLFIGLDLIGHMWDTLGMLPDDVLDTLIQEFDVSPKDAMSLVSLDEGKRLEYFLTIVDFLMAQYSDDIDFEYYQHTVNWILHELPRLTAERSDEPAQDLGFTTDGECLRMPARHFADIMIHLFNGEINTRVAKELLWFVFRGRVPGEYPTVLDAIAGEDLWFRELSMDEYEALADTALQGQDDILRHFIDVLIFPRGKLMFLVGRMIRIGPEERIDPNTAESVLRRKIRDDYAPNLKIRDNRAARLLEEKDSGRLCSGSGTA
ncbi:hypothetical protein EKO27_g7974 [Xylaria grammica]|uniref:Glutamyl-tRNA(Gln) amidotransferase subunit B, mitochondrial n=1 Tax=Xylaria grammica TaxID=363999 RepID=A0A439CY48_9PEZI|nr:hypothetical protein EKO27_g7974 [Xylaria grammica]